MKEETSKQIGKKESDSMLEKMTIVGYDEKCDLHSDNILQSLYYHIGI